MKHKITVWENNKKETIETQEENLLNFLFKHNYEVNSYCGGHGICGKCKIKVISGIKEPVREERKLLDKNDIDNGIRLACLQKISDDMEIELKNTADIKIYTAGMSEETKINQKFKKQLVIIEKPTLCDQRDFARRILDFLSLKKIHPKAIIDLDKINKNDEITVTIKDREIIQLKGGNTVDYLYGIAIDIGTTTIVLYLLDLNSGNEIDVYSLYNPQKKFGADVISRIKYAMENKRGKDNLKLELLKGLNKGINKLVQRNYITNEDLMYITVVGNTIMLHTLLGVDLKSIAESPYIPLFTNSLILTPEIAGMEINKNGVIQLLPLVSGYIGADILADILAANFDFNKINLLIDIGTNGEIILNSGKKIFACSTAAGPAFEGANITFGMAGLPGAIANFKFGENGELEYKTIDNHPPRGICGSGLVDIIAEIYNSNLINFKGAFISKEDMPAIHQKRMTTYKKFKAYRIALSQKAEEDKDILITQNDIREVQLAKGAIQAGIKILVKEIGVEFKDIDKVFIAGGFGNYIDPHSACVIGLIPGILEEKIIQIGNGAGTGAKLYLLNKDLKKYTEEIKEKINYIELSKRKDFQQEFVNSMQFK